MLTNRLETQDFVFLVWIKENFYDHSSMPIRCFSCHNHCWNGRCTRTQKQKPKLSAWLVRAPISQLSENSKERLKISKKRNKNILNTQNYLYLTVFVNLNNSFSVCGFIFVTFSLFFLVYLTKNKFYCSEGLLLRKLVYCAPGFLLQALAIVQHLIF